MYKSVVVCKGAGGWGGPITLIPTAQRHVILSVTGGGIHPIAKQLGELSGCEVVAEVRHGAVFIPGRASTRLTWFPSGVAGL